MKIDSNKLIYLVTIDLYLE